MITPEQAETIRECDQAAIERLHLLFASKLGDGERTFRFEATPKVAEAVLKSYATASATL